MVTVFILLQNSVTLTEFTHERSLSGSDLEIKNLKIFIEVGRDFQFDVNPVKFLRNTMQMHTIFLEPILKSTLINHSTS